MVVVARDRAAAVDGFAVGVSQDIDETVVGKRLQDAVGRGQGHRDTLVLEEPVQFLRAHEVVQFVQRGTDGQSLLGDALLPDGGILRGRNRLGCGPGRGGIGAL